MTEETHKPTDPMESKKDVRESNDPQIDKDFEGFPANLASKKIINPENPTDKKTAGLHREPMNAYQNPDDKEDTQINEQASDGSGGAFSQTELVDDDKGKKRENPDVNY